LRGASIHPGFAFGEQTVDQYRKIAAHGFDRRLEQCRKAMYAMAVSIAQ